MFQFYGQKTVSFDIVQLTHTMSLELKENHALCLYSFFFQIVKRP